MIMVMTLCYTTDGVMSVGRYSNSYSYSSPHHHDGHIWWACLPVTTPPQRACLVGMFTQLPHHHDGHVWWACLPSYYTTEKATRLGRVIIMMGLSYSSLIEKYDLYICLLGYIHRERLWCYQISAPRVAGCFYP